MATLTPTTVTRAGVALAGTAATVTTGDVFTNTGTQFLFVKNGGGAPTTVTLKFGTNGKVDGQAGTERTVSVTNGTEQIIGPFPPYTYNDANGQVTVVCSPVTSVTVQVITCPGA
jgi:hypothetical protein